MKLEEKIISELAYDLKRSLIKRVIKDLKADGKILESDKSCLENRWEEFCVTVQDDRAYYMFDKYKNDVVHLLSEHFNELSFYEKISIWLKSMEGIDWLYDKKELSAEFDDVPFHFADCRDMLFEMIVEWAKEFDDDNVYRYINLNCKAYKDDYDNDDREQVYE